MQKLIGRVILNEERGLMTWCIKGMVGAGKTDLARQVNNHAAVVGRFQRRAWVSLSSDTSMKEVLLQLIKQLAVSGREELDGDSLLPEKMDNESLRQMLHQHLKGMPYFIVVDNVLPEMRLQSFLEGLPREGGRYLDNASPSYWESFELLNILDLEDFGVNTLSEIIGTLIELRYLGLRNHYIQEIPHSFGGLKKLEALDIALNFMVEVPDNIGEMVGLRHLHMSDVICRKQLDIDVLQNLETLTYISIYDWTYEVSSLEKMTRLHKLGIEEVDENSDVSKLFASLAKLESLYRLNLRGFHFKSMPCLDELGVLEGEFCQLKLDGLIARLPIYFPPNITYLVLVNTCFDEGPMPLLLPNAYTGRQMLIPDYTFMGNQVLRINELWNLRNVQVGEYAMWKLNQLEIKNCPHLETLPEAIWSMEKLRKLKMVTTKYIATKIRNAGLISKILEVDISP